LDRYDLILFGSEEENAVAQRIAGSMPMRCREGSIRFQDRAFEAAGKGFSLVYPNPLRPDRLVVWNAGATWGLGLEPNHWLDFLPDFVVFSSETDSDGANRVLLSGFFDSEWRIDPTLVRFEEASQDARTGAR
jgi:hypothetical protein